jgi:gas vesicle protein
MINNSEDTQVKSKFNGVGNNLLYLLVGGGIGAAMGLLFAPKPGRELRQDVSDGVKYGLETTNEKVSQLRETAGEKASQLKVAADDYYHRAQDKVSELYRVVKKTVSDGTEEANALANDTADQVQNGITDPMQNGMADPMQEAANENPAPEPPLFDSGSKPFDQRDIKTGIL